MEKEKIQKLRTLYFRYSEIHHALDQLDREAELLLSKQRQLSSELHQLRSEEKELINNLELDITPEEIIKLINEEQ